MPQSIIHPVPSAESVSKGRLQGGTATTLLELRLRGAGSLAAQAAGVEAVEVRIIFREAPPLVVTVTRGDFAVQTARPDEAESLVALSDPEVPAQQPQASAQSAEARTDDASVEENRDSDSDFPESAKDAVSDVIAREVAASTPPMNQPGQPDQPQPPQPPTAIAPEPAPRVTLPPVPI